MHDLIKLTATYIDHSVNEKDVGDISITVKPLI